MIRNRAFFNQVLSISLLLGILLICSILDVQFWFLVLISLLILLSQIYFTSDRYRKIRKLHDDLYRFNNGETALDILDNEEGELSILRNEITKVLTALNHQVEISTKDKVSLAKNLSDISHQLKTPLTSLYIQADLLAETTLTKQEQDQCIFNILLNLDRMDGLISSILKMSQLDADAVQFKNVDIDLVLLFSRCEKLLEPLLFSKRQTFHIDKGEYRIFGDETWLLEAFVNLLKNASDHSYNDSIIEIKFDRNQLYVEVRIRDYGEGIDSKDMPRIFERFYRGTNQNDVGTGIGLSLAYEIIKKHHGEVDVVSQLGQGTTFILKFYNLSI